MDQETLNSIIQKQILPHLVCVTVSYRIAGKRNDQAPPEYKVFSGFIIQQKDKWFWITAGHILESLDQLVISEDQGLITNLSVRLTAGFHLEVDRLRPIPLTFPQKGRFLHGNYEEPNLNGSTGLDYGFYELNNLEIENLKNDDVKPFYRAKETLINEPGFENFSQILLVGVPEANVKRLSDGNFFMEAAIIDLEIQPNDDWFDQRSKRTRYVFSLPQEYTLDSVVGMSGGPVIGIHEGVPDRIYLLGIQSSEIRTQRKVSVCSISDALNDLRQTGIWEDFSGAE